MGGVAQWVVLLLGTLVAVLASAGDAAGENSAPVPIDEAFVPGQIIVKFSDSVLQDPSSLLDAGQPFRDATTDGSESLDRLVDEYQVSDARPVFGSPGEAEAAGGSAERAGLDKVYVLEVDDGADVRDAAAAFDADPHVEYAQANYIVKAQYTPNDPYLQSAGSWGQTYDDLWGLKNIDAEQAWDVTQGEGVVVAVVDTGIDYNHPDIAANVWVNTGETAGNGLDDDLNGYVDDVRGWDFVTFDDGVEDNDPLDGNGHGTHVSGTIAAIGNNGIGIVGVAPKATIMPVKALSDTGSGSSDDLARALSYAANNGARVINNSWSCSVPCPEDLVLAGAVRYAHSLDAVVVFAAGNSDEDVALRSPQNQPESVVVAGTNELDTLTYFWGKGVKVDVAAPGVGSSTAPPSYAPYRNVLSLWSTVAPADPGLVVGGQYVRNAGTSMSTPHVAGLAALVIAAHPTFTNEQVRQAIRVSADDVYTPGFDIRTGHGRINAARAVAVDTALAVMITSPRDGLEVTTAAELQIRGTAAGAGLVSYQLSYGAGDAPASWTPIGAAGSSEIVGGVLGTLDIASLPIDRYTLRLEATDGEGKVFDTYAMIIKENIDLPGRLAFTSRRDGYSGIYIMDAAGITRVPLTYARDPAWSPDGTKFAMVGYDGDFEIYTVGVDGSGLQQLTFNGLYDTDDEPVWSPDGSKIAFTSGADGDDEINVINADGSGLQQLTQNNVADRSPSWAPDGTKIAFERATTNTEIMVMNTDGSGETNLTNSPYYEEEPAWSPDGTQIAYVGTGPISPDIFVMSADGTGRQDLTASTYPAFYWEDEPAWSFDGSRIAFKSHTGDELWMINVDGSGLTRITANPAPDTAPDWDWSPRLIDTDGDRCPDVDEQRTAVGSENRGGRRDYLNPWDYFNPTLDGTNRTDDIIAVVLHYGHDQGLFGDYDVKYDRTALVGGHAWQFGPPDGTIRTFDITAAVLSYGHDCS